MLNTGFLTPDDGTTLDNTFGAMLIGALLSMGLWGVTCTQTYDYFMNNDNTDGRLQRSIVALLWMIETLASVTHSHIAYHYLVTSFANPNGLGKATWSLHSLAIVSGISNFIIRLMFARRIYQFGQRNIIVPVLIMTISFGELVSNFVTVAKGFNPVVLYLSFAFGLTADLSVTVALSWLLQSAKSGFRESDSIVNVLMAYVVNTGLLVTLFTVVGLITFIVMPHNMVFLAIVILVSKLYVNAYLATLNARKRLRSLNSEGVSLGSRLGASNLQGRDARDIVLKSDEKTKSSTLAISFEKTVERRVDDASGELKHPHAV